jgi:NADH-quinone oxidoreductase subunit I
MSLLARGVPYKFRYSMALVVNRPKLSLGERLYLPAILGGLAITLKHLKKLVFGETKVTMQYPEERWDAHLPSWYRGAPALVKDEHGKDRCVACQLCEFICPPRAITIVPEEIPATDRWAKVEKRPKEFEIDMIRCIYCGLCEEVCPEQAIFLKKEYSITGYTRAEMVHDKEKLYEIGGVMEGLVYKWNEKK